VLPRPLLELGFEFEGKRITFLGPSDIWKPAPVRGQNGAPSAALRSRRKTRGLTQQQVAGRMGLLPKMISALENGPDRSTLESFFKLLAALDLELIIRPKGEAAAREVRGEW
jgi:HTH-type transcriptional regulator/antitoxin HipB